MTFFTTYFVPMFICAIAATLVTWVENPRGERQITLRDAGIIAGISIVPVLNMIVAVAFVALIFVDAFCWCAAKVGLMSLFHDSDRRVLFSDRNKK